MVGEDADRRSVLIVTNEPKALDAVHKVLRFHIAERETGDSTAVRPLE
jgi:hypothetical protein